MGNFQNISYSCYACVGTNIISHACHNFVFVFAIFSGMVFLTRELQPVFCRLRSESGMKLVVTGVMDGVDFKN